MAYLIPLSGFDQEITEAARMLAQLGDVDAHVTGSASVHVSFVVDAPGYGLPTAAVFEFSEWFHRSDQGWLRERYAYEYRPLDSRKAHHMGHSGVTGPHQHCEPPGRRASAHYGDHERLLRPTAEELATVFARRRPIDCRGLRRLRGSDVREVPDFDD